MILFYAFNVLKLKLFICSCHESEKYTIIITIVVGYVTKTSNTGKLQNNKRLQNTLDILFNFAILFIFITSIFLSCHPNGMDLKYIDYPVTHTHFGVQAL